MERLAANDLRKLLTASASASTGAGTPCVSLYLPLGLTEDERQGARMRLQSLLRQAQETLMRHYPAVASALSKSLVALVERLPQAVPGRGGAGLWRPSGSFARSAGSRATTAWPA